jgi:predicted dehydrogenase
VVLKALQWVRDGAYGEVAGADFFLSSRYPTYGGGTPLPPCFVNGSFPLQDLGVRGLCLLEAFLGPVRHADVRYYASGLGDPNLVIDEWRAMVECERGAGQIYLSWNVRPLQNEIVVHGTRGVLLVDCCLETLTLRTTYAGSPVAQRVLGAGFNSAGDIHPNGLSLRRRPARRGVRERNRRNRHGCAVHRDLEPVVVRTWTAFVRATRERRAPAAGDDESRPAGCTGNRLIETVIM